MNGIDDTLTGVADVGSSLPGNAGLVGKALKGGLGVGKALGPIVFSGDSSAIAPEDGQYHGTTGNSWVDWAAGVGKYSVSRF